MGSSTRRSIVAQGRRVSYFLSRCFVLIAGVSSYRNTSEYRAIATVLMNRGTGFFLFVMACCSERSVSSSSHHTQLSAYWAYKCLCHENKPRVPVLLGAKWTWKCVVCVTAAYSLRPKVMPGSVPKRHLTRFSAVSCHQVTLHFLHKGAKVRVIF
jgi:Na+/melibiose symporter-like transporter